MFFLIYALGGTTVYVVYTSVHSVQFTPEYTGCCIIYTYRQYRQYRQYTSTLFSTLIEFILNVKVGKPF